MHPELFHFHLFGFKYSLYTYATLIVFGTLVGVLYTKWRVRKNLGKVHLPNIFFYFIFIAGFIGGKIFFYLENPSRYFNNPKLLLDNFSEDLFFMVLLFL